ncbi:hypothetical protein B0H13DRAFT_1913303 [Mycena leptocephala]|nr:hypothetical protein B0H13DRAFT_1913303 [Mycena leptocephala]
MDSRLPETAAALKSCKHAIRGVQLAPDDLESLEPGAKIKVPGALMNVVGALLQTLGDQNGCDFAVFSTWLSPLVSRKVKQGTHYGTIAGHIQDACQGQKEMLLAKSRWLFPLYGDEPPHWVLGWVDLSAHKMHIFDSCPELQSYMWAEPALVEVAETVFTTLGKPEIDLEHWDVMKHSPSLLQRQMNGFACGFFVIHGMRVVGNGESVACVTNDQTAKVKSETLDLIKDNLPLLRLQSKLAVPSNDVVVVGPAEETAAAADLEVSLTPIASPTPTPSGPDIDMTTQTQPIVAVASRDLETQARRRGASSFEKTSKKEAPPPSKPSKKTAQPEHKLKSTDERKEILKASEYTAQVEAHRVLCAKCHSWIALHSTRKFKIENWTQHVGNCPQINGKVNVRSAVTKKALGPVTPSVASIFEPGPIKNPPPKPIIIKAAKSCAGLLGGRYTEYIERTETRSMGGVSPALYARVIRQVLAYKNFATLKREGTVDSTQPVECSVPADGNKCLPAPDWTPTEHGKVDDALRGFARWEVNFGKKTLRSTRCEGLTTNDDGICDACAKVATDSSLVHAINRKNREAELPLEEQHQIEVNRAKYSAHRFHDLEGRNLDLLLRDPVTFAALKALEKGESTECFLLLYEATLNGKIKDYETIKEMCMVTTEVIKLKEANTMNGIRYSSHYLNFTILMRGYGGNSARQYGILSGEIPLPSMRHVRALVPKSADALHNPYLIFENMAQVKRLVDSINYSGPVAVAGDCTKVKKRLTFSNDFGGHILGSVWELEDCIAEDPADIERVITEITKAKAEANQVCAILIKVPLPHIPPQVVALLPTNGTDDASKIFEQHLKLLAMAAELSLPVVSFSADGAASELAAPVNETGPVVSGQDPGHGKNTARNGPQSGARTEDLGEDVVVNNTLVDLQKTGVSGLLPSDVKNVDKQDDGPARHLFHVMALRACTIGEGDRTTIREGFGGLFVYLFVMGVLFDAWLNRTMTVANRVLAVLRARFFLHFWRAHIINMSNKYPDLYSTARSFITAPSFHIFNRLCDSLLLLVIIYARRYPGQPFCPWLLGTEFVEHFFGLAQMMLPNFTWAEFIKLVQHVMVRQRILLSGSFKEKRERNARVGYVLDFDASPLTAEDRKLAEWNSRSWRPRSFARNCFIFRSQNRQNGNLSGRVAPLGVPTPKAKSSGAGENFDSDDDDYDEEEEEPSTPDPILDNLRSEVPRAIASASHGAARYAALCEDYEDTVNELNSQSEPSTHATTLGPPPSPPAVAIVAPASPSLPFKSEIIDASGKRSISMMLQA